MIRQSKMNGFENVVKGMSGLKKTKWPNLYCQIVPLLGLYFKTGSSGVSFI